MSQQYYLSLTPIPAGREPTPIHVPCPVCGAFSGSVCRTKRGAAIFPVHATRITKFKQWKLKKEQA